MAVIQLMFNLLHKKDKSEHWIIPVKLPIET